MVLRSSRNSDPGSHSIIGNSHAPSSLLVSCLALPIARRLQLFITSSPVDTPDTTMTKASRSKRGHPSPVETSDNVSLVPIIQSIHIYIYTRYVYTSKYIYIPGMYILRSIYIYICCYMKDNPESYDFRHGRLLLIPIRPESRQSESWHRREGGSMGFLLVSEVFFFRESYERDQRWRSWCTFICRMAREIITLEGNTPSLLDGSYGSWLLLTESSPIKPETCRGIPGIPLPLYCRGGVFSMKHAKQIIYIYIYIYIC